MSELPVPGPGSALLLDAAGTLLRPREPIADSYAALARAQGVEVSASVIAARFGPIMKQAAPLRRAAPDWRPFWAAVVEHCTDSDDPALLDALLEHFRRAQAWCVATGAERCVSLARARGMKVALVSNWDLHLRPLLRELGIAPWFDAIVISAEEGLEKPDVQMFERACARVGVAVQHALHVGDDADADVAGARAAGCAALWFGRDVVDFDALGERLGL